SDKDLNAVINYIKGPHYDPDNKSEMNGINPAKIKTIWNEKFQNTLLATKEFEERLVSIFGTCNESVLDIYVNNLDKNLSALDSIAYDVTGKDVFKKFASRNDGKVKNGNKNVQLLKKYFEEKTKAFTEAIAKTKNEFWKKQSDADAKAYQQQQDHSINDEKRLDDNFQKELDLNLDNAYQQLGMKRQKGGNSAPSANPIPPATYGVAVTSTGWCNIDACVLENTLARTTIDFTNKQTGKRAVIKYEPLKISVNDSKNYDRVLIYLLPDELNSFMRVEKKNENFEEQLNELMVYKMVCIAYKGEESFYFSQDNVRPGSLNVSLTKTTNAIIQNNVNQLSNHGQVKAMNDELNFFAFEKEEAKRQVELAKINELTNKITPVILPCIASEVTDTTAIPAPAKKGKK
ncbi:MAG: hypothetical protein ACXVNN_09090, partial [Bacteroidia bacterium]